MSENRVVNFSPSSMFSMDLLDSADMKDSWSPKGPLLENNQHSFQQQSQFQPSQLQQQIGAAEAMESFFGYYPAFDPLGIANPFEARVAASKTHGAFATDLFKDTNTFLALNNMDHPPYEAALLATTAPPPALLSQSRASQPSSETGSPSAPNSSNEIREAVAPIKRKGQDGKSTEEKKEHAPPKRTRVRRPSVVEAPTFGPQASDDDGLVFEADDDDLSRQKSNLPAPARYVCALYLESLNDLQCRFAVKNEAKAANAALYSVQKNGYVEYKARYSKKKENQQIYGNFRVAFKPSNQVIFPFMLSRDEPANAGKAPIVISRDLLQPEHLYRLEIIVRMYQSFRGSYPITRVRFDDGEMFQPLYASNWQDHSLLRGYAAEYEGMSATQDIDGEYIRYTVHGPELLKRLFTEEGVKFPCPIPVHPEKLNDVGVLRMQTRIKLFVNSAASPEAQAFSGSKFDVWCRVKFVQQITGEKKSYINMLRPYPSHEWSYPPRPTFLPTSIAVQNVVKHVMGRSTLLGSESVEFIGSVSSEVARRAQLPQSSETSLHYTIETGNINILRVILQSNLFLMKQKDANGNSLLHLAALHNHFNICKMLFESGGIVTERNNDGLTPADLARNMNFNEIATYLDSHEVNESLYGCETLFRAAAIGALLCVRTKLGKGEAVDQVNMEGQTPLYLAVHNNNPFTTSLLLAAGANVTQMDHQKGTLLHVAAERSYCGVGAFLVTHHPPLMEMRDRFGRTPLHICAMHGSVLMTQMLISAGADFRARDNDFKTPLDVAAKNTFPGTWLVLFRANNPTTPPPQLDMMPQRLEAPNLFVGAKLGDVVLVRRLLLTGSQPNELGPDGSTAIKIAAEHDNLLVLHELLMTHRDLLDSGRLLVDENVNIYGADGFTPVHAACKQNAFGCLMVLLSSKMVDVNALSRDGLTALHIAAERGYTLVSALLLLWGADVTVKTIEGLTASDLARRNGHICPLKLLETPKHEIEVVVQCVFNSKPLGPITHGTQRSPLGFILSSEANWKLLEDYKGAFLWEGVQEVLARMWQASQSLLAVFSQSRRKVAVSS